MKLSFNERIDNIERKIKEKRRESKQKNSTGKSQSNTRQKTEK